MDHDRRHSPGLVGAAVIFLGALALTPPSAAWAQQGGVGMRSTMASVQLFATAAPRGSIDAVSEPVVTSRGGSTRQVVVTLRGSANTAFHVVVRGNSDARISVQAKDHRFHELQSALPFTVVQQARCNGSWEGQVRYRIDTPENTGLAVLPVWYEMVLAPEP
jgi:hypothetical protein